jgi:hypothetical protein
MPQSYLAYGMQNEGRIEILTMILSLPWNNQQS